MFNGAPLIETTENVLACCVYAMCNCVCVILSISVFTIGFSIFHIDNGLKRHSKKKNCFVHIGTPMLC